MPAVADILAEAVENALRTVLGPDQTAPALIRTCADSQFGDYQANGIMAAAKQRRINPRELAQQVVAQLEVDDIAEPPAVAGAGFINFRLQPAFVARQLAAAAIDGRLGVPCSETPKTIVIDFSSPNVAKPMHVGHIRSTTIGDCLARVARFLGHRVVTDNHLGDWGTQFGMLIVGWKQFRDDDALAKDPTAELERLYKLVYSNCQQDPQRRTEARDELAKLQRGDPENQQIWQRIIDLSRQEFEQVYDRLGVTFDHTLGESFYNPVLSEVVETLRGLGLARQSEGAWCVFFDDIPALKKTAPMLVQKADGAFLYATTDLATIKYRLAEFQPHEIIYVTDARQKLHFQQLFTVASKWWNTGNLQAGEDTGSAKEARPFPVLKHVYFGSVLGEDGKPLKTREGEPVKLTDLLNEAEDRALAVVAEKSPELPLEERKRIARAVGLGAVKYADLSQNRVSDYLFSWSKMLAMTGNTAPYMQYAYVRVQSIFRKAAGTVAAPGDQAALAELALEHPAEIELGKHLLRFPDVLEAVYQDDKPNWLTAYLYDLAGKFSSFYDSCPVIQSTEPVRSSRLMLCRLTADVIRQGLDLLGIDVIEQM